MWTIVLVISAVIAFFWLKNRARVMKAQRDMRVSIKAGEKEKLKQQVHRPLTQRLHTALPDGAVRRMLAWRPERRIRRYVLIARRGLSWVAERVDPAQHIMVIGFTGSGKSSALRVLAAWALRNPAWSLEAWDGKWGASVRAYLGKCPVLDTMDAIEARLDDLVERELPARARIPEPPHLGIIMDESRLLNELSAAGMRNLVTVIQTGRELGVHLWFGLQDPKTDSVPSEVRDQFSCKLVHQLQTREAAQVALKDLVSSGWHAHKLMRSGQMLIWTPVRGMRPPRVVYGIWLSVTRLASVPRVGPFQAPVSVRPVVLEKASVRPSGYKGAGQAGGRGRTDAPTDRQAQALAALDMGGPMGAADLARELGVARNRAHDTLTQLDRRGLVSRSADGTYELTEGRS